MRNKLRPPLIAALFYLLLVPFVARAAEPAPGDACPAAGRVTRTGGPETSGVGNTLVCQGGTWKSAFGFDGTAQVTKIGNQTCSTNDLLKFDGTKWICGTTPADAILESMLKAVNAPTDEYCLTYESTTGDFEWQTCGAGGDNLGNHTATTNINLGANYISRAGTAAGLSLDASNNATFSGDLTISGDDLFMATNTAGRVLIADGTNFNPTAVSGDITITGAGVTTIGAGKVTDAMLDAVDAAQSEECLTYDTIAEAFEWQPCDGASVSRVTSTFSKTNSTLSAITGLSATLTAGKTYTFAIELYTTAINNVGIKVDLNGGTATATAIIGNALIVEPNMPYAVTYLSPRITALNTVLCNSESLIQTTCRISGTITVGTGGTFIPRFAQYTTNGTASTVAIGSTMIVQQIN